MFILEFMSISIAVLHLIKDFGFLLVLRVSTGIVGGISLGVIPPLLHDFFSAGRSTLGGILCYVVVTIFATTAAMMDTFVGGLEGLTKNYKLILYWPAIFGGTRLILMLIFLHKFESPQFYLENEQLDEQQIQEKLLIYFNSVYLKEDAEKSMQLKIQERREELEQKTLGSGLIQLFSKRNRSKFIFGIMLNQFRQLAGVTILTFFSTQIFNEISGNGPFITMLNSFVDLGTALITIFTKNFRRVKTYSLAMIANTISMVAIAIAVLIKSSGLATASICLFSCSFAIGNGSMLNVYISEFLSVSGIGYSIAVRWVTAALISYVLPSVKDALGIPALFFISAGFGLLHVLMLMIYGVETFNKGKHEIDDEFAGVKSSHSQLET